MNTIELRKKVIAAMQKAVRAAETAVGQKAFQEQLSESIETGFSGAIELVLTLHFQPGGLNHIKTRYGYEQYHKLNSSE